MPILDDFCVAFEQALTEYETENTDITRTRRNEVTALRHRLEECKCHEADSIVLRNEMITYVQNIPAVSVLAFIAYFDSRLRKKLQGVLDDERFSERTLSTQERIEMKREYTTQLHHLTDQVKALKDQLAVERAKYNVQAVNALLNAFECEKQKTEFLTLEKNTLEEKLTSTHESFIEITTEYDKVLREKNHWQQTAQDFQEKYEALLQNSSSIAETKKYPIPSVFI